MSEVGRRRQRSRKRKRPSDSWDRRSSGPMKAVGGVDSPPAKRPLVGGPAVSTAAARLAQMRDKVLRKVQGGQFRMLNEQLYTSSGAAAYDMFSKDPSLFNVYHKGFREQVSRWPVNPLDIIIRRVACVYRGPLVIGDFGCGDAELAASATEHRVHSFDLVAVNERVTACDISNVPLEDASLDVAVFSLSLMGTDYVDFLKEADRVLKSGGLLVVAEVRSRVEGGPDEATHGFSSSSGSIGFGAGGRRGPRDAHRRQREAFVEQLQSIGKGYDVMWEDFSNPFFLLVELCKKGDTPGTPAVSSVTRSKEYVAQCPALGTPGASQDGVARRGKNRERGQGRGQGRGRGRGRGSGRSEHGAAADTAFRLKPCIYKRR